MTDLISRAALLKECAECQKTDPRFEERGWANHFLNEAGEPSTEWYCVEDMIENAPAVDAVPVIRCKDCRFAKVENNYGFDEVICYNEEFGPRCPVPLDWFCADGERRES